MTSQQLPGACARSCELLTAGPACSSVGAEHIDRPPTFCYIGGRGENIWLLDAGV
jgi:hypothetical protein